MKLSFIFLFIHSVNTSAQWHDELLRAQYTYLDNNFGKKLYNLHNILGSKNV